MHGEPFLPPLWGRMRPFGEVICSAGGVNDEITALRLDGQIQHKMVDTDRSWSLLDISYQSKQLRYASRFMHQNIYLIEHGMSM